MKNVWAMVDWQVIHYIALASNIALCWWLGMSGRWAGSRERRRGKNGGTWVGREEKTSRLRNLPWDEGIYSRTTARIQVSQTAVLSLAHWWAASYFYFFHRFFFTYMYISAQEMSVGPSVLFTQLAWDLRQITGTLWVCDFLDWTYLASLSLKFSICQVGWIVTQTSERWCEDYLR